MKRVKSRAKNKLMLACLLVFLVGGIGFLLSSKISGKENTSVKDSNTVENNDKDDSENNRENKVVDIPSDVNNNDGKKVAYLTFDDGPSTNNTPKILDILKQNNIKATFFLIGKNAEENKELVKREIQEGHVVANHTYTHQLNYKEGPEGFVKDLDKCDKVLKSIIGDSYNMKLIRFPGGSFGKKLAPFREAVTKAGYHYVDWNDLTGDAEHNNVPVSNLLGNLKKYTVNDHVVILMHDASAKTTTVDALPQVIEYLKSKGYVFDILK